MNINNYDLDDWKSLSNIEAEQAVIGSILLDEDKINSVSEIITYEDFFYKPLAIVYKTLLSMHIQNDVGYDTIQLMAKLENTDIVEFSTKSNFSSFLKLTMDIVSSTSCVFDYAQIVKNYSVARQAKQIINDLSVNIQAETAIEQTQQVAEKLIAITQNGGKDKLVPMGDVAVQTYCSFFNKEQSKLLYTGYSKFDKLLSGLEKGNLCIIAARPGTGKTAFAINLIGNFIRQQKKTAFFSLEMENSEVMRRLFSTKSQVQMNDLKAHNCDNYAPQLAETANWFVSHENNLFLYDKSRCTVQDIRNQCILKSGLDVIVIDYLGYMKPSKYYKNNNDSIGEITGDLKALAKDLGVPIICLSQLNRAVESRSDNRPNLSDLRDSGSIEQDANQIIFLFLEDKTDPKFSNIGVYIAKNRDGEQGTTLMNFNRSTQTFCEIEENYTPRYERKSKNKLEFE